MYSPCPPGWLLTTFSLEGDKYYEASGFIQVSIPVEGGANNHIRLKAADNITFSPGFEAKVGSYVHGFIGTCGSGIPD